MKKNIILSFYLFVLQTLQNIVVNLTGEKQVEIIPSCWGLIPVVVKNWGDTGKRGF